MRRAIHRRRRPRCQCRADGKRLEQAAAGKGNVTFAYPANANHVFKEDTRPLAEVVVAPGTGYNEEGTHLDPEAVERRSWVGSAGPPLELVT